MLKILATIVLAAASTTAAAAQGPVPAATDTSLSSSSGGDASSPPGAGSRHAVIEQEESARNASLQPYVPSKGERIFDKFEALVDGTRWHPFLENAYAGGGFTLGAGHVTYVSGDNYFDVRGSYTISGYKRAEVEFVAPRLFQRRGHLSAIGGWRDATQVGFYGIGPNTDKNDRTNYRFQQPYGNALLTLFPTRRLLLLSGGAEFARWSQKSGEGSFPSVETQNTPETLPGLGAEINYLHTQGTVGIDWRTSPGYTRRGGFYGVTVHDYNDRDDDFGFQMIEYEAIQHIPILREAWVLSFRARVQHANDKDDQQIPFFMLPALGGGSTLRGFSSWRFRDRNSLLLQGEWRIMVNRYLDMAFFYDAGNVAPRTKDLHFDHLKDDFGFGLRFHGPFSTMLRPELAKSSEGYRFIFSSSAVF